MSLAALNTHSLIVAKIIIALAFVAAGVGKLMGTASLHASFHLLGLPEWFGYFIGICQLLGAIGLFISPLSAAAALGSMLILLGAVYFHIVHPPITQGIPASLLVLLCLFVFWKTKGDFLHMKARHSAH